jgi:hypothetical protein
VNCPNCPSSLICPEGGIGYCGECGWGTTQWWADKYALANVRIGELQAQLNAAIDGRDRIRELELRIGELIDAILTHRRETPPGASNIDHVLWNAVATRSQTEGTDDG